MAVMRGIRYIAWVLVIIFGGFLAWATINWYHSAPTSTKLSNVPSIGGEFKLIDHEGSEVTDKDLVGEPSLLFFGFTHCPDVCPSTLVEIQTWIEALGKDANHFNYFFVSVDPERDTPAVLASYLSAFDPRIRGLSGSSEAVKKMTKAYHVYAQKVSLEDGNYTMDHTASIYLLDHKGHFSGTIAYGENHDIALSKLRKLIGKIPQKNRDN